MVACLSLGPNTVLSPLLDRTRPICPPIPLRHTQFGSPFLPQHRPLSRGSLGITRFGLGQLPFPQPDDAQGMFQQLFGRVEALVYTIADAAVSNSSPDAVTATTTKSAVNQSSDWLSGITNSMEAVLKVLKDVLTSFHVPYSYGFAIILLTFLVKAGTFPLTKKQVESAMAMRSLQPQIKAIQERYAGNQEKIQLETARLYKLAGINPLAGCLPTLATIPVWIGLYRALSNVANEGLLTEGFFWIPSLAGPTTIAARQNGGGISWLFPFVDGHPPLGWSDTLAYLVLPILLVITQYISVQIMQPPQSDDPNMKSSQVITKFLPLMIGYFALSVPSGLSLYWFTNNILSTVQQIWLQKLGGAKNPVRRLNEDIIKEEQSQIQNSVLDTRNKMVEKNEEKLTAEGLRPGERFRQIKEHEALRRHQRDEEKSKAEEALANSIPMPTNALRNEGSEAGIEDGAKAESLEAHSATTKDSSSGEHHFVNGDGSSTVSVEDQQGSTNRIEGIDTSANGESVRNDLRCSQNGTEEGAVATAGAKESTFQREDTTENVRKL